MSPYPVRPASGRAAARHARAAALLVLAASAVLGAQAPGAATERDPASPLPDRKGRPEHTLFAGVPWGTAADRLPGLLRAHGYAEVKGSRGRDRLHFTGRLFERFATVDALLDEDRRLARWEIAIPARGERDDYPVQRAIYDDAVREMESKYGRRRMAEDRFRFPYTKGDGWEARALRDELATIRSVWESSAGDRLSIEMDSKVTVLLRYESPAWRKAEDQRRRRKARDL